MKKLFRVQCIRRWGKDNNIVGDPVDYYVIANDDVKAKKKVSQYLTIQGLNVTQYELFARPIARQFSNHIFI